MKHILEIFCIVAILMGAMACETEFDLNAPYKRIPVIYGLLDGGLDTQYVMINRSYLGEGNALEFTGNEDSMLYDNVDAQIRWTLGSQEGIVPLTETVVSGKQTNGIFYGPSITVYGVATNQISPLDNSNPNAEYFLEIVADGEVILAETKVPFIGIGIITSPPPPSAVSNVNFVDDFVFGETVYNDDFRFEFDFVENADLHEASLIVRYTEILSGGGTRNRSISIPFGEVTDTNESGSDFKFERDGSIFYLGIQDRIDRSDPQVVNRQFNSVDFVLAVAGEDLSTYLGVGSSVSSVGQERPTFSNINDGEGVGVFSSRARAVQSYGLGADSFAELVNGQYTGDLCFCSSDPGSQYYCFGGGECQ